MLTFVMSMFLQCNFSPQSIETTDKTGLTCSISFFLSEFFNIEKYKPQPWGDTILHSFLAVVYSNGSQ